MVVVYKCEQQDSQAPLKVCSTLLKESHSCPAVGPRHLSYSANRNSLDCKKTSRELEISVPS